ncbi:MAG: hypothetical protein H7Y39_10810 [Nitrospiraceae bacterium]|nr:hypothetical protein [Nitrospiraceae bacterium]
MKRQWLSVLLIGLLSGVLSACLSFAETPGERFQKVMKEMVDLCARVMDLQHNDVLGVRRGFIRSSGVRNLTGIWWLGWQVCPIKKALSSSRFIQKVLIPASEKQ